MLVKQQIFHATMQVKWGFLLLFLTSIILNNSKSLNLGKVMTIKTFVLMANVLILEF